MKKTDNIKSIIWYVPLELNHSSYIYTSVISFCQKHKIKFQISSKNLNKKGRVDVVDNNAVFTKNSYPKVTYLKVLYDDMTSMLLAFDLHDSSTFFSLEALNISDVVYKRCYKQQIVNCLPNEYALKVQRMGLPFMVRPTKLLFNKKFISLFFLLRANELVKLDRNILRNIKGGVLVPYKQWMAFLKTRTELDFYNYSKKELSNIIFYQKRLFPNEKDKDTKEVHQQRIEIIKLLKSNFSIFFKGGLKKDIISLQYCPESISNIDGSPKEFLKALRSCGICIYTRGLTNSTGWTLPEFLSQGKCIVAEKLDNEFPFPLIHNVHVLFFETNEELIEICKKLISNISEINRLGKNARLYYEKHVAPSIFMENILNRL